MTKENLNQGSEDQESKQDAESESEEGSENESDESESQEKESSEDDRVAKLEKDIADLKKGTAKFFSEKGREQKAQETTNASDDVTEMFFEHTPNAELVKEELKTIADKLYNGSIIKAWKGEEWLHAKAQSISEANKAKSKIQSPGNQIGEGEIDFKTIKAEQISKLSDKDYARYQDYMRKQSVTPGRITLS